MKKVGRLAEPGRYKDSERGLYLRVASKTSKSWLFRFERNGVERWMGLGAGADVDLPEAREKARAARKMIADGTDPLEAREAEKAAKAAEAAKAAKAKTFRQCAESYVAGREGTWRNPKHRAQWAATLKTYVYPVIGELPVAAVDTDLVLQIVEPLWTSRTETASRVRGRIEVVLSWAIARGLRSGPNPAQWRGHLDQILPPRSKAQTVQHHAALAYAEVPALMAELEGREGIAARALRFVILTACRTGEAIRATWDEIDLDAALWTLPAGRMKAGREHRVPLSAETLAILRALPREDGNPHVFVGGRQGAGLSGMAMSRLLGKLRAGLTVHGMRATFKTWTAESTAFPRHVVELALAHAVGDKLEAAYQRGDLLQQRVKLADAWARHCTTPPAPADNVRPMRQSAG